MHSLNVYCVTDTRGKPQSVFSIFTYCLEQYFRYQISGGFLYISISSPAGINWTSSNSNPFLHCLAKDSVPKTILHFDCLLKVLGCDLIYDRQSICNWSSRPSPQIDYLARIVLLTIKDITKNADERHACEVGSVGIRALLTYLPPRTYMILAVCKLIQTPGLL